MDEREIGRNTVSSEQKWWAGGIHDCPDNGLEYVIYTRSESGGDLIVAFATGEEEREQIIADHNVRLTDVQQDDTSQCPKCKHAAHLPGSCKYDPGNQWNPDAYCWCGYGERL